MDIAGPYTLTVPAYPATDAELTVRLRGMIFGVGIKYETGGAVDVAITEENDNAPTLDVLAVADANTDGWFAPVTAIHDADGAVIADQYSVGTPISGNIVIALTNAQADDIVHVTFKLG